MHETSNQRQRQSRSIAPYLAKNYAAARIQVSTADLAKRQVDQMSHCPRLGSIVARIAARITRSPASKRYCYSLCPKPRLNNLSVSMCIILSHNASSCCRSGAILLSRYEVERMVHCNVCSFPRLCLQTARFSKCP
jgi:hypothetical protein